MFQDSGRMVSKVGGRSVGGLAAVGMLIPGLAKIGGAIFFGLLGFTIRIFGRREYLAYGIPAAILLILAFGLGGLGVLTFTGMPQMIAGWFGVEGQALFFLFRNDFAPAATLFSIYLILMAPFFMYCGFYVKALYDMNSRLAQGYQISWWLTPPLTLVALILLGEAGYIDRLERVLPSNGFLVFLVIISSSVLIGLYAVMSFRLARAWTNYSVKNTLAKSLNVPYTDEVEKKIKGQINKEVELAKKQAKARLKISMKAIIVFTLIMSVILLIITLKAI